LASAFLAEELGVALNVTVTAVAAAPATLTALLANTICAGRHLPLTLIWLAPHWLLLAEKAPKVPFGNVSSHAKMPGLETDAVNVMAPVFVLTIGFLCRLKSLSGAVGVNGGASGSGADAAGGGLGVGVAMSAGGLATAKDCCASGAGL
jgi:hypothetical protein